MKIAYLLEDTELAGGVRVAVAHADVLTDRGHDVTLVTKGRPLNWRSSHAKWEYLSTFDELDAAPFHFVIGTFWTTLADTLRIAGRRGVHLVQGDEGSFTAYRHLQPRIHAAFRLPLPKITVSPHLVAISRAFYDDALRRADRRRLLLPAARRLERDPAAAPGGAVGGGLQGARRRLRGRPPRAPARRPVRSRAGLAVASRAG